MNFSKEIAQAVIKKNGLSESTLYVWRKRGGIPARYFTENDTLAEKAVGETITDAQKYRLLAVYRLQNLNHSEIQSIKIQRFADLERDKGRILKREYIAFKKEVTDLKNKFESVLQAKSRGAKQNELRLFFKDPRIKPFSFALNKSDFKYAIECLTSKKYEVEDDILEQIKLNVALFFQSAIL